MFNTVVHCLQEQHDPHLLAAAILICLISSTTAIYLLGNCNTSQSGSITFKLLPAICITSIGIWATHFVAILGYDTGLKTHYSLGLTAAAALFAFVTVAFGMVFGAYFNSVISHALGGVYLGLGISVMHLLGMFALKVPGSLVFHVPSTAVAIFGCCLISGSAFALFARLRSGWRYPLASVLLVLAVCTLHFISMSWTRFVPSPEYPDIEKGINGTVLAIVVFSLWVFVSVLALARHWAYRADDGNDPSPEPSP